MAIIMEKLKLNHIKIKNIMIKWENPNLKKKEEITLDLLKATLGLFVGFL